MINETDLLIERIKNWKAEKDEEEYRAKIEEENKVAGFMEKMNNEILKESKNIIKVLNTLQNCGMKNVPDFKGHSIKFAYNGRWSLRFDFRDCVGYVFDNLDEFSFKKKDSCGFSTSYKSDPPHSFEFENVFKCFENFKKAFYDFVEQTLKN